MYLLVLCIFRYGIQLHMYVQYATEYIAFFDKFPLLDGRALYLHTQRTVSICRTISASCVYLVGSMSTVRERERGGGKEERRRRVENIYANDCRHVAPGITYFAGK